MQTTQQFLKAVYNAISKRRDSYVEMVMALAASHQVESVVALSESALYQRTFSSIYETLREVEIEEAALLKANVAMLAGCSQVLDGYEVYSGDSTFVKRSEAHTLPRSMKRLSSGELVYGHETYWTMRLGEPQTSWSGVVTVERMKQASVTEMAAAHMQRFDEYNSNAKLIVLDAGHGQAVLAGYQACQHTDIVMRLKSGQVFYQSPAPYQGRGRPRKHGMRFKLTAEAASPDEQQTITFKCKTLRISLWRDLHYASYSDIHGVILRLEFLDSDGKPLFSKPIWLFSTATNAKPETLARAYLWRSSHELTFRFLKQHLGLTSCQSPILTCCDNWYQLVALAMNLLLSLRDQLANTPPPWYPQARHKTVSQRQAQKQSLAFLLNVSTPIKPTQPAGKAPGRPMGYHPPPRTRHPVIRKTPKRRKTCPTCPLRAAS
ncbi:MAG: transposase [Cyanothece sp. SIO2G6]|nr:transposase [Cyanothece sp. SIO2G6]